MTVLIPHAGRMSVGAAGSRGGAAYRALSAIPSGPQVELVGDNSSGSNS